MKKIALQRKEGSKKSRFQKKQRGRKEGSKKTALKTKKKKRAHEKKTAGKKGGRNRAPSFLVNLAATCPIFGVQFGPQQTQVG